MSMQENGRIRKLLPAAGLFLLIICLAFLFLKGLIRNADNGDPSLSGEDVSAAGEPTAAPRILGVRDREMRPGDSVLYKAGVTALDCLDRPLEVEVDSSAVNPLQPGSYTVIYRASDEWGQTVTAEAIFTVLGDDPAETAAASAEATDEPAGPDDSGKDPAESGGSSEDPVPQTASEPGHDPSEGGHEPLIVNGLDVRAYDLEAEIEAVCEEILNENMSDRQKARAVYVWCRESVKYQDITHEGTMEDAALYALIRRRGSCYMFFAVAEVLLNHAGIQTIPVQTIYFEGADMHYWQLVNIDGAWWHFDTTPRRSGGEFFLWSDEQMLSFNDDHGCFCFDIRLYPRTPGVLSAAHQIPLGDGTAEPTVGPTHDPGTATEESGDNDKLYESGETLVPHDPEATETTLTPYDPDETEEPLTPYDPDEPQEPVIIGDP